jgi:ATP-dependent Zn protease
MFLRIILWGLLFLLVLRIVKNIFNAFKTSGSNKQQSQFRKRDQHSKIDKKDIIDAEFEDVTESESEKK